jgi:hypothetical protein
MLQYEYLSEDEWEQSAPAKKAKPSPWDNLLAELEQGKILKLPIEDEKEKRGYRIGIARRARQHGYKVEFREIAGGIALKKGRTLEPKGSARAPQEAVPARDSTPAAKKGGRPRKVKATATRG